MRGEMCIAAAALMLLGSVVVGCGDDGDGDSKASTGGTGGAEMGGSGGGTSGSSGVGGAAGDGGAAGGIIDQQALDTAKTALDKYLDISVALEVGFVSTHDFVIDDHGGMGIHFINPKIQSIAPYDPNVLLYGVNEDGEYQLLAAEWFFPSDQFEEPPELFGRTFDGPMPGHEPGQPEHYELHAWLWKDNPDGVFSAYNPEVAPPSYWPDITVAYGAAEAYMDASAALDDGFVNTMDCVEEPGSGGMGIHFTNEAAMMSGELDPSKPHILLYGPDGNGGYELLGLEWFVPADAVTEAPTLFGQSFKGPMAGHEPGQPDHYDLHVWLQKTNPKGYFAPFNPAYGCPAL